ncbi:MAG: non-hydrolyzing UDP-N-acetylglucosamine 2-epimerase [Candidatus Thorarchaeota archaeon]
MFVSLVTGTRPQIIKTAPVLSALAEFGIEHEFIHTGQHYDYELAGAFIDGFELDSPMDLEVGSGDYSYQVYTIMQRLASHYKMNRPDLMIVPGDTTSALGAALVGFKMEIAVCHLESGLRRFDLSFQEEVNRRLIDHGASALFAPTKIAVDNLNAEQVQGKVYHIGDTMYDVLKNRLPKYTDVSYREQVFSKIGTREKEYAVLTMHRRESVDRANTLANIVTGLNSVDFPIIFPVHPRARKRLEEFSLKLDDSHIHICDPLSYDEFMSLVAASKLVISDSGGIQKECYLLNIPIVSLQERTEWVETLEAGASTLTALEPERIVHNCNRMYGLKLSNDPSVYGDGNAAKRIPPIIESGEIAIPTDRRELSYVDYYNLGG